MSSDVKLVMVVKVVTDCYRQKVTDCYGIIEQTHEINKLFPHKRSVIV